SRVIILFSTMHPHRSILCPYTTLFRSISTVQKIEEDTYLFHEGDRADEIYIIKSGLIEISKLAANGKEMLLRICKNSDLIGELTDRKSTRLNSSHVSISYAVFCLKKKK